MGSIIGPKIDYNGVWDLGSQWHIPKYTIPPLLKFSYSQFGYRVFLVSKVNSGCFLFVWQLEVSENESKRLQQRTKHLETQLELARKSAELGADSISVDEIMRKTTQDMRSARNSRVIRPSRAVAPSPSVSSSPGFKLPRISSNDSLGTKNTSSTDSGKGTKESGMKGSKGSASKKNKDEGNGRHKLGTERITSSLCSVM